ncbi:MAG TPA: hypothetical protein VFA65_16590 [Bryobacteraceae bacterium]|nr:hypothetical protein [Bryobacteraceae bacterium]
MFAVRELNGNSYVGGLLLGQKASEDRPLHWLMPESAQEKGSGIAEDTEQSIESYSVHA